MRKLTILVIPDRGSEKSWQFQLPLWVFNVLSVSILVFAALFGFFYFDYIALRGLRNEHDILVTENQHLKGESQLLANNIEKVNVSLKHIQDYATKLQELVTFRVDTLQQKTGLVKTLKNQGAGDPAHPAEKVTPQSSIIIPEGLSIDSMIFKASFEKLQTLDYSVQINSAQLKDLLSTLGQKQTLIASIPSFAPVQGWITSNFGYRIHPFSGERVLHKGLDIAAPPGTPIYAPADGVVVFSGKQHEYGNLIIISHHGNTILTRYGHCTQIMVQPGQTIRKGDEVGTVGMTGQASGPHLHYEVHINGSAVNPQKFILDSLSQIL